MPPLLSELDSPILLGSTSGRQPAARPVRACWTEEKIPCVLQLLFASPPFVLRGLAVLARGAEWKKTKVAWPNLPFTHSRMCLGGVCASTFPQVCPPEASKQTSKYSAAALPLCDYSTTKVYRNMPYRNPSMSR